jgi:hypothetical protein
MGLDWRLARCMDQVLGTWRRLLGALARQVLRTPVGRATLECMYGEVLAKLEPQKGCAWSLGQNFLSGRQFGRLICHM